jgi:tRNA modification GTPase
MSAARDTIYALSSGSPPAGIAVVRVSGSAVVQTIQSCCGGVTLDRRAALKTIRSPRGDIVDHGIVVYFAGPNSFTGEDCVEFHLHGGRAVVAAMLSALEELGLRQAEAGEFSRRAFDNGRLDLVEIEALADLIGAETEMQRRLAIDQGGGSLSSVYLGWMQDLTRARAWVEAELDFPDEEDIPGAVGDRADAIVRSVMVSIDTHLEGSKAAEIIRDGFKVVIAGRPNAGKSSLMNSLAKRDVAIVTAVAGTTRDIISVDLDLGGYLVRLTDTAGLRETDDVVEAEGVRRARASIDEADLVILLLEHGDAGGDHLVAGHGSVLTVVSKADMTGYDKPECSDGAILSISSVTGFGIDSLTERIRDLASQARLTPGQAMVARRRQIGLLKDVRNLLSRYGSAAEEGLELKTEYLRQAAHILGKTTGFVDTDTLLGVIFSEFCVGK